MYSSIYYLLVNIPFIAALFWIAFILRSPYPTDKSRRIVLLAYMVNSAILMFASSTFFQSDTSIYSTSKLLQIFTLVNTFPLYFMYIKLITTNVKFNRKHLLALLPGAVLAAITGFVFYTATDQEMAQIYYIFQHGHQLAGLNWVAYFMLGIDLVTTITIFLTTTLMVLNIKKSLAEYKHAISQYYADAPNKVHGLTFEITVGAIYSIIVVFGSLFGGIELYQYNLFGLFLAVVVATLPMFIIGNHSQFQRFYISDFDKELQNDSEVVNVVNHNTSKPIDNIEQVYDKKEELVDVNISEINLNYLADRILEIVQSRKLYLNPDLRITDISKALSTNRTYISQAINHKLGGNFSDFINNFRIEHTKQLLSDPSKQNLTIEAVAEESGYATVASLNRLFKIKTGITPNQYRQSMLLGRLGKKREDL